jgi:hypothetical protein
LGDEGAGLPCCFGALLALPDQLVEPVDMITIEGNLGTCP